MKSLMICSSNVNLQESLAAILQSDFTVYCCSPELSHIESFEKYQPDICFFDREVFNNADLDYIKNAREKKADTWIILAYYYYEAHDMPETKIRELVDNIILKPYQFDLLIQNLGQYK